MRQLFIPKKKNFTEETVEIVTRDQDVAYYVQSNHSDQNNVFTIYNNKDTAVVSIQTDGEGMAPSFTVTVKDEIKFKVEQIITPLSKSYDIKGYGLTLNGDWSDMNFDVMYGYRKVAKIRNRCMPSRDMYDITIFEDDNEYTVLGLFALLTSLVEEQQLVYM